MYPYELYLEETMSFDENSTFYGFGKNDSFRWKKEYFSVLIGRNDSFKVFGKNGDPVTVLLHGGVHSCSHPARTFPT